MAGTLWTIEYFGCPNCGLRYTATREPHSGKRSGSFSCEVCGVEVHAWSGKHDFFGWRVDQVARLWQKVGLTTIPRRGRNLPLHNQLKTADGDCGREFSALRPAVYGVNPPVDGGFPIL